MSARVTVTDEMIEKGREAREGHYLRVSPVSCTCGWRSDTYIEADGLPRFEAHLVELALEAAAPLIAAAAWDEGYAMSERELDHAYGGHPISPDGPSDLCHECGTGNPYRAVGIERGES